MVLAPPDLGCWAQSSTGVAFVHERAASAPGPEVLLTALVHGNEYSGALALDAFLKSGLLPSRGRITAAFCNVAAFERFDAQAPDASRFVDEDFNRVWRTVYLDAAGHSAERVRALELRPFVNRATHLLDLHSMHEPGPPLLVTGVLPRNVAFAQKLRTASQVVIDQGHADGTRMRDYGPFSDPDGARVALLLEAGQHWQAESLLVARNVLMRFLVTAGSLEAASVPPGWQLADATPPAALEVTHAVVADSMEFAFEHDFRGGECVPVASTVIAHNGGKPVCTPYDNCVLVMPSVRQLRPGVTTVRLARLARSATE